MGFVKEFKEFALKGNVHMAVGVIIAPLSAGWWVRCSAR
jgi:large-conductance mechanosensitive channel